MKRFLFVLILSFIYSNSTLLAEIKIHSDSSSVIKGIWQGTLKVQGMELRLVFKINEEENGKFKATLDSPDQGAKDIPVDSVIYSDGILKLISNAIRGYFEGTYIADSIAFEGKWHQSGMSFALIIKKVDKIEEVKRPQEPKPPFPYRVEDVIYENRIAGIKLGGTLTLPESGVPFPAVLLITGSGAQNRDEELFGHKPFMVIADYLTRHGIAVLRVDDRGIGESTGNFSASTTKDFATDVLSGVEYLKSRKEINPKEIGLIGHSEGGIIAPMVATETNNVAFIVLMAGTGIPGDQVLLTQTEAIEKLNGASEEKIKEDLELNKKIYDVLKEDKDSSAIAHKLYKIYTDSYNKLSSDKKAEIGDPKIAFERGIKTVMSPWFRYFVKYNPYPILEKVKCPVLALNGSKDVQVLPSINLPAIKNALEEGGNKNFEVKELPGLNHLFQTANTGAPSEYGKIEETISPIALQTIGNWILKIVKK